LDGLTSFDVTKLREVDSLKIKKIEVVTKKYFSGNNAIEGAKNWSVTNVIAAL
jgi:hypothetical protein